MREGGTGRWSPAALFASARRRRYLARERRAHRETRHSRKRRFLGDHVRKGGIGAEIGVFWGHFAETMLEVFEPAHLHLVDPWDLLHGPRFNFTSRYTLDGDLRPAEAEAHVRAFAACQRGRVSVHKMFSQDFFARMPEASLDWVYIDGSHIYENVLADLRAALPRVAADGVILGDDFNPDPSRADNGVHRAATQFAAEEGLELEALDHYQFALRRKANAARES